MFYIKFASIHLIYQYILQLDFSQSFVEKPDI